jgi:hypothetical protein
MAGVAAVAVALFSAGAANADNSNTNSNTNDVTSFGTEDSSGTAQSASESTNWPPTDISWPPKDIVSPGTDSSKGGSGSKPIVMPFDQPAPASSATPSTPEAVKPTPTPIVPAERP